MAFRFYTSSGALKSTGDGAGGDTTPVGFVADFAGSTAPSGWLLCDGSGLDTTAYAALFAVIGYQYGGAGSTFNLPDAQGRATVGLGTHADVNALGDNEGLGVASRTPNHAHTVDSHTHDLSNHSHTIAHTHTLNNHSHTLGNHSHTISTVSSNNGSVHTHGVNTGGPSSTGSSVSLGAGGLRADSNHTHSATSSTANAAHGHNISTTSSSNNGNTGSDNSDSGGASAGSSGAPSNNTSSGPSAQGTDTEGVGFIVFNKIIKY